MKNFMDEDFLLSTETAKKLYHGYASKVPVIDYHCHINPQEIAEDRSFDTITQVWLGGDHYKWRQMRTDGVEEYFITGDASDQDKFQKWANTLQKAIGNPLYHWSHLELQRYFNITEPLTVHNAKKIYEACNEKLKDKSMSVRNLIKNSNVDCICTTDDPIDTLEWHKMIKNDKSFDVKVLPAFRPDKAMNIEKPDFTDYIYKLRLASNTRIKTFDDLKSALINRMDHFESMGCCVSDHAPDFVMYEPASMEQIETIFAKRIHDKEITKKEELQYKTAFLLFCGREYHKRNWVMQLHFGTNRNNNTSMFHTIGADTGFDCIKTGFSLDGLTGLLDDLNKTNELPKTILYSLNPNDNAAIGTILGCFQDASARGKLQQGSAWWFNDNKTGMIEQMTSLANLGLLANFVGMLTDSRSFLSYTRHEYFRRILCDMIGTLVENGEYPNDLEYLGEMVQNISYYNTKNYFGF